MAEKITSTNNDAMITVSSPEAESRVTSNTETGDGRSPRGAPATICFGTLNTTFSQNITLERIFKGMDCTAKSPDRTYFDWIASQFGYIFPKAAANFIRIFILIKAGGVAFPVVNQLLANVRIPANQIAPPDQIPILPVVNGQLQPFNAGGAVAPIPANALACQKLLLRAVGWWADNYLQELLESGLQDMTDTIINGIRNGTSQMSVISVINQTRFPFKVSDQAAYKGGIVTTFNRLEPMDAVEEGSFRYIGIFTSDSTWVTGSASAVAITSDASTVSTNDKFIIAAAAPITGKRTTLISINDPNMTALNLADKNDTKGEGFFHCEGNGNAFHICADVEQNAVRDYCHVRVIITEINPIDEVKA